MHTYLKAYNLYDDSKADMIDWLIGFKADNLYDDNKADMIDWLYRLQG